MLFPEIRLYPSSQLYPGMPLPRTPTTAVFTPDASRGIPQADDMLAAMAALLSQTQPASGDSDALPQADASQSLVTSISTRSDIDSRTSEALILG
jgi:hypothetical protein